MSPVHTIERIGRALEKLKHRYLPQSQMGKAVSYALNQWTMLERFLDHGEVELDNNLVENAIRPTALGKNYAEVAVMWRSSVTPTPRERSGVDARAIGAIAISA